MHELVAGISDTTVNGVPSRESLWENNSVRLCNVYHRETLLMAAFPGTTGMYTLRFSFPANSLTSRERTMALSMKLASKDTTGSAAPSCFPCGILNASSHVPSVAAVCLVATSPSQQAERGQMHLKLNCGLWLEFTKCTLWHYGSWTLGFL